MHSGRDIRVEIPGDVRIRKVIDSFAKFVSRNGAGFERVIENEEEKAWYERERNLGAQPFGFLFDRGSSEHVYYALGLAKQFSETSRESEVFLHHQNYYEIAAICAFC